MSNNYVCMTLMLCDVLDPQQRFHSWLPYNTTHWNLFHLWFLKGAQVSTSLFCMTFSRLIPAAYRPTPTNPLQALSHVPVSAALSLRNLFLFHTLKHMTFLCPLVKREKPHVKCLFPNSFERNETYVFQPAVFFWYLKSFKYVDKKRMIWRKYNIFLLLWKHTFDCRTHSSGTEMIIYLYL